MAWPPDLPGTLQTSGWSLRPEEEAKDVTHAVGPMWQNMHTIGFHEGLSEVLTYMVEGCRV